MQHQNGPKVNFPTNDAKIEIAFFYTAIFDAKLERHKFRVPTVSNPTPNPTSILNEDQSLTELKTSSEQS